MTKPLLPGARIGVIGGGQLGRMLAMAARRMGYRLHVFTDEVDGPASQWADETTVSDYANYDRLDAFLRQVDVVTYETENIPLALAERAAELSLLRPNLELLKLSQHRWREKTGLAVLGLPVAPFRAVRSPADLATALAAFGGAGVLKSTSGGYDGKGQWMIRQPADAERAAREALAGNQEASSRSENGNADHRWADQRSSRGEFTAEASEPPFILEAIVDFQLEFSVIGARSAGQEFATFGPILNVHRHHILDVSVCPSGLADSVVQESVAIARTLAEQLDVVGLFCIEYFLTSDERVVINEIAPRTHNSGHLTMEGHAVSQFEQQVRAICGLPLGSTQQLAPAAMVNLLGDVWLDTPPQWLAAFASHCYLHLYGKREPRAGRKMGHLTALGSTAEEARSRACRARDGLRQSDGS